MSAPKEIDDALSLLAPYADAADLPDPLRRAIAALRAAAADRAPAAPFEVSVPFGFVAVLGGGVLLTLLLELALVLLAIMTLILLAAHVAEHGEEIARDVRAAADELSRIAALVGALAMAMVIQAQRLRDRTEEIDRDLRRYGIDCGRHLGALLTAIDELIAFLNRDTVEAILRTGNFTEGFLLNLIGRIEPVLAALQAFIECLYRRGHGVTNIDERVRRLIGPQGALQERLDALRARLRRLQR